MKLAICLPLYGALTPNFFVNFLNRLHELYNNGRNYEVKIYMKMATVVDRARNELVDEALSDNCDYILFLDSDIITPNGAIDKLIDRDLDIVSGLYFQKSKPYLPVARLEKGDKHLFLEDFNYGELMEVAGVGMGLCLIKADVFRHLKYPFFKFEWKEDPNGGRPFELAEDLYFCDEARKAGYKIILDTGCLLEHDGAPIGEAHFNIYKTELARDKRDRDELITDLAEFDKITEEEVTKILKNNNALRTAQFDEIVKDKNNSEQIDKYYRENTYEIYDHFNWHINGRRNFDKKLIADIKAKYPDKSTEILDFGCGGGEVAYQLALEGYQVSVIEKNIKANDFISFRFAKHRKKIKKIPLPLHPQFTNQYDVILCFDVLEHVPDKDFENIINQIKSLRKPDGQVFATVSFGAEEAHKSHYGMTETKKELIMDLLK